MANVERRDQWIVATIVENEPRSGSAGAEEGRIENCPTDRYSQPQLELCGRRRLYSKGCRVRDSGRKKQGMGSYGGGNLDYDSGGAVALQCPSLA